MLKKTLRKNGNVQVGFYTEPLPEATTVHLVGSFNGWDEQATPMKRLKGDRFTKSKSFALNSRHEYRYLVDGVEWRNDHAADEYAPNPHGSENSVLLT